MITRLLFGGQKSNRLSVIPCRLIVGLHERFNEIPAVLTRHLVKLMSGEYSGVLQWDEKTP